METDVQRCETCGNSYERCFEIRIADQSHWFDSFECAIYALAPRCAKCSIPIVGHGVEADARIYCCANCSRAAGESGIRDSV